MKTSLFFSLAIFCFLFSLQTLQSQETIEIENHNVISQNGAIPSPGYFSPVPLIPSKCIPDATRTEVKQTLIANKQEILRTRPDAFNRSGNHPLFVLPIKAKDGFDDYGYYTVNFQVDHDATPNNNLLDYNCAQRTYDWGTGNHEGTDYILWPYPWKSMDEEIMEIIAAADGTIIDKRDGHFDLNCAINGNPNWNGIVLEHADGSQTWYWHFKDGAITSKGIGDTVVAGEYLGAAGSSGSSNWPHLHFEVYNNNGDLIDPYEGPCNDMNPDTWWVNQPDYFVPAINRIATHNTAQFDDACAVIENTYEELNFFPGDDLIIRLFYRDIQQGATTDFMILDPDGVEYVSWSWTQNWGADYATAHAHWEFDVTAAWPEGVYTMQTTFDGTVYETIFGVGTNLGVEDINVPIFEIYPNPVSEKLFISSVQTIDAITLYDVRGRKVMESIGNKTSATLDMTSLKAGVYFVQINAEGSLSTHKVIKK
tara:strand:+ start:26928 stop:28370 length:1443 start_codon:yes stop_codon:yes gene_type:complete